MTTHTLAELCDAYLAETQLDHEKSTHYQQRTFLRTVGQELGSLPLEQVTPDVLRDWKLRLSQRSKPSTVGRYLMYMQHVLDYGMEVEWLDVNPLRQIRKPSPGR